MNAISTRIAALLGAALLCLGLGSARAEQVWYPAQGLYWNPAEHGIYYHVSVGDTGFMYVAITGYRPDGSPDFLMMQGQFAAHSRAQWQATGSLGTLTGPLYRMQNGQCLGCPYRNPQAVASEYGEASIEFLNDGRATLRSRAFNATLVRNALFTGTGELPRHRLAGQWAVTHTFFGNTYNGIVNIGGAFPDRPGVGPAFAPFPPNTRLGWACVSGDCQGLGAPIYDNRAVGALDTGMLRILTIFCTRFLCQDDADGGVVLLDREGMMLGRQPSATSTQGGEWTLRSVTRADGMPRASDGSIPWRPSNGLWWNPSEHGIYYHVNSNASGFMFVGITTYEPDGKPTHLMMQGDYQPTSIAQWRATREIGRLRATLYRMQGGQCFGCAHREPRNSASEFGDAEIVFYSGNVAEFRQGGRTVAIERNRLVTAAAQVEASAARRLRGRWFATTVDGNRTIQTGRLDILPRFGNASDSFNTVRCANCDPAIAALVYNENQGPGFASNDNGLHFAGSYFVAFGQQFSPRYAFHERDGVLYGRAPLASSAQQYEVVMHRIGDAPP